MDVHEAEAQVRRLAGEWAEQKRAAETATRNARALNKIVVGYVEMFPELGPLVEDLGEAAREADDGTPKGASAVRKILHGSPNDWWLVSELVREMEERGWLPDSENPGNAIRTALERLIASDDSDVYKGKRGQNVVYAYLPDQAPTERPIVVAEPAYDEEPF